MPRRIWSFSLLLAVACTPSPADKGRIGDSARPHDPTPSTMTSKLSPVQTTVSLEDIADLPYPGTVVPGSLAFSPDDRHLTYLESPDRSLSRQLFSLALGDASAAPKLAVEAPGGGVTEANLSKEEKLRRERQRVRGLGITRYTWSKAGEKILIPLTGDIYVKDGLEGPLTRIIDTEGAPALDPQFSPDGARVAYVRDAELHVVSSAGGPPHQVTYGARGTGKTQGLAEYIAMEEMARFHGFWWSKDSSKLAFTEVDETHIPIYRIVHQGESTVGNASQEDHHYPFAGQANARIRLGVVAADGGPVTWMDISGLGSDAYLARVRWLPDGTLTAQIEDREQSHLRLLRFNPKNGEATVLLEESSDVWINLHDIFHPLKGTHKEDAKLAGAFIWASENTGFRHLYLHDTTGTRLRALTSGPWMVDELIAVDELTEKFWFTATRESPTQMHLYEADFTGSPPRKVTQAPGMHTVTIDHAHKRFLDVHNARDTAPSVTLRSLADGALIRAIPSRKDPRLSRFELPSPEIVELESRDGTKLYGAIYRPDPKMHGQGPYPTVISVYGGPHAQRVTDSWSLTVDMRAQYLRERGYLVFRLDNRGSGRRGLAFEGAIKHDMGRLEVQDQVDGVHWLAKQGLCDPDRVAIYGWSYGGYMSAMALARAPETFQVAIAGAPVTSWDGYDTHYTERYMGTPQGNPEGYERSSVMHHVDGIQGNLLLVHGLIDENVHFRHTARLIDAMIRARKDYALALFPNERHSPRRPEDRVFMEQQIFAFLERNLQETLKLPETHAVTP